MNIEQKPKKFALSKKGNHIENNFFVSIGDTNRTSEKFVKIFYFPTKEILIKYYIDRFGLFTNKS